MRVAFVSNYFNHHQSEIAKAWNDLTNGQYIFIETSKMREERKKLGYGGDKPPYIKSCMTDEQEQEIASEIEKADVVIFGSAPERMLKKRQQQAKLIFRYSERIYKDEYQWYKWPFRIWTFYKKFGRHSNTYLLCSSAYTAADYAKHFTFLNKAYKWGYFPPCEKYENLEDLIANKQKQTILWCGRYLDFKHPDDLLTVAKRLKEEGISFCVNYIGNGEMENELISKIREYDLCDCVQLLGSMPPDKVREHMKNAGIYVFTSDYHEGWGAVLNESMNSACAVVASHAIGAVPFLIKDKENGFIYESGNIEDLYEKVKYLLCHTGEQDRVGNAAYHTILKEWNAEVAADRLLHLAEHILNGEKHPDLYESGPCSRAPIIKDNWYCGGGNRR